MVTIRKAPVERLNSPRSRNPETSYGETIPRLFVIRFVGLVSEVKPAGDIVREIVSDAKIVLAVLLMLR
jgi:hypothetical protein